MSRSRKKETVLTLRSVLSVLGFVFELYRLIVHGLEKRKGGIEHLRRLIKEPQLLDRVLDLVVLEPLREWKTWKTIVHPKGKLMPEEVFQTLKQANCRVTVCFKEAMRSFGPFSYETDTAVELALVSSAELGFDESVSYEDILERAQILGLDLCRPEDAPRLRLSYLDQPRDEGLEMAMDIAPRNGELQHFVVSREGGLLYMSVSGVVESARLPPKTRFIFRRRQTTVK